MQKAIVKKRCGSLLFTAEKRETIWTGFSGKKLLVLFVLFLLVVCIPFLSLLIKSVNRPLKTPTKVLKTDAQERFFTVLDKSTDEEIKISEREFLYANVLTEMLPSFEKEALKAQAVSSYTYFMRLKKNKTPGMSFDFAVDTKNWQCFVTYNQIKERFGASFENYYNKVKNCVDDVYGQYLEQDGEPILAMYHAISPGNTEACEDVFGGKLSYLNSVASPGDLFAPNYQTVSSVSEDDFKKTIEGKFKNANFCNEPSLWIKDIETTTSGLVKTINIGGVAIPGSDIRNLFSLRSSHFLIEYKYGRFFFDVRGYGHGVGLSQYGAEYMASQGADYKEILYWYYKGSKLSNIA